jgi:hypothetical protein
MAGGFAHPWVVFLGSLWRQERDFVRSVMARVDRNRYVRLVEPCAGSMAISLLGRDLGWQPKQMDASDVSFYSAVLGYTASGQDLASLDVRIDDEPIVLDGPATRQAAVLLYEQLRLRQLAR